MQISDKKGTTDIVSLFIEQISTSPYTNSNQVIPFSVKLKVADMFMLRCLIL